MAYQLAVNFIVFAAALIVSALLVLVRIGFGRLESEIGIQRDGPPVGKTIPRFVLPDRRGSDRVIPGRDEQWQLLVFADHSLESFPEVVFAMNHLAARESVDVLMLNRPSSILSNGTIEDLDILVPVVDVSQRLCDRYAVRVVPFGILVDPMGVTRWKGIVGHVGVMLRILRVAKQDYEPSPIGTAWLPERSA